MAVFSYIATTAFWASVTTAIGAAAAGAIIAAGQAITWSLASAALMRPKVSRQVVQATINQADQPRIRAYGRNLLGGVRAFYEARNGLLVQVVVVHHGRIDGLIRFWFNGEPMGEAFQGGELKRYVVLEFHDGSGDGGAFGFVQSAFPDQWTTAHRLAGQATFAAGFGDPSDRNFQKVFPKGADTPVQVEIRGLRVPPVGGGTPVYSENAGLCLHDLMTHADGWNIAPAFIDADTWRAFVALCDQRVPLKDGGTEARYRLSGYYSLDDPLKEVTSRMLATCDGQIYQTAEGKVGILGGAWSEPDVTLTDDDIQSVEMSDGFDPFTDYNILRGSFVSPDHTYQPVEVQDLRDDAAIALQEERSDQLEIDMCPSSGQIQRLMKIRYAKDHRDMVGTITTNLVGMKARFPKGDGIHTIRIAAPGFGIDGVFEVTGHAFDIPSRRCTIGIASLRNPYAWHAPSEERPLPPTAEDLRSPKEPVPVPTGALLTQEVFRIAGDTMGVMVAVQVDDPGRDGLRLEAQIAKGTFTANGPWTIPFPKWVEMPADQLRAQSGVLENQTDYTVRIRWEGYGDWIRVGTIAVLAEPDPPAAPTNVRGMADGAAAVLQWTNAPQAYFRTQIFMGTSTSFASASAGAMVAGVSGRADSYTHDLTGVVGTRRFWLRTLNASGVPSAPAGPVSVTIPAPA